MFVIYVKGGANWQEVSKLGRGKSDTNHPQIKQKLLSFLQPSIVLTSILFYAAGTGDVAGHHHVTRVTIHQVTQVTVDHTKSHQARVLHSAPKMTLWPVFLHSQREKWAGPKKLCQCFLGKSGQNVTDLNEGRERDKTEWPKWAKPLFFFLALLFLLLLFGCRPLISPFSWWKSEINCLFKIFFFSAQTPLPPPAQNGKREKVVWANWGLLLLNPLRRCRHHLQLTHWKISKEMPNGYAQNFQ